MVSSRVPVPQFSNQHPVCVWGGGQWVAVCSFTGGLICQQMDEEQKGGGGDEEKDEESESVTGCNVDRKSEAA